MRSSGQHRSADQGRRRVLSRPVRFDRLAAVVLAALALSPATVAPASAQGLFEALFGRIHHRPVYRLPPQATPFADPFRMFDRDRRMSGDVGGPATAFCVRACDGRFFPIQRHARMSTAEACKSFCPASPTMVFQGSKIDYAVGPRGIRYSNLENAFLYRRRLVDNCTCNGKDAFGLVRLDVKEDPTLHPGDIVATRNGLATVRNPKTAEFTPVDPKSALAAVKVMPVPPQDKVEPVSDVSALRMRRSVQLSR
jgi:hypothetical protein